MNDTLLFAIRGKSLIGYTVASSGKEFVKAKSALDGTELEGEFYSATTEEIHKAVEKAQHAFLQLKKTKPEQRALFLEEVAAGLELERKSITERARVESALSPVRLDGELNRTIAQLKLFATVLRNALYTDASIDRAFNEDGTLRMDVRRMQIPLGPVVVFGASNFPLAFSVAGGDTASAWAAGCPVIVKAHNGHPGTSDLVAATILKAGRKCNMPDGFFSLIYGRGVEAGMELVKHPLVKAVGFTGSYQGGKALFDAANQRKEPIPVYAEMGSLNPVLLLPAALNKRNEQLAASFAGSITQGCGQFCTKPGIFLAKAGADLDKFIALLKTRLGEIDAQPMLNEHINKAFKAGILKNVAGHKGVEFFPAGKPAEGFSVQAGVAVTNGKVFLTSSHLQEELFGPFALIVVCADKAELMAVAESVGGQLTATVIAEESELDLYEELIDVLKERSGRIIFNGVPTGVEVCHSMHHGGPFPSSSFSQYTSVGSDAIRRFLRPLCFQAWPEAALPRELKNENPDNIWRRVNGKLTNDKL